MQLDSSSSDKVHRASRPSNLWIRQHLRSEIPEENDTHPRVPHTMSLFFPVQIGWVERKHRGNCPTKSVAKTQLHLIEQNCIFVSYRSVGFERFQHTSRLESSFVDEFQNRSIAVCHWESYLDRNSIDRQRTRCVFFSKSPIPLS